MLWLITLAWPPSTHAQPPPDAPPPDAANDPATDDPSTDDPSTDDPSTDDADDPDADNAPPPDAANDTDNAPPDTPDADAPPDGPDAAGDPTPDDPTAGGAADDVSGEGGASPSTGNLKPGATSTPMLPGGKEDEDDPSRPRLRFLGLRAQDESFVREAIGTMPRPGAALETWGEIALKRVIDAYHIAGYSYARGWVGVADNEVTLEIDEGRMDQIIFIGADILRGLMLQVDLNLPGKIFHAQTVEVALAEIQAKHGFTNIYYRIRELPDRMVNTQLERIAPQRVMTVFMVSRESFGWRIGLGVSAQYGLVPYFRFRAHRVLMESEDRLRGEVGVGTPYRRFLYDAEPRFQWVHGHVNLEYELPPIYRQAAPALGLGFDSSFQGRSDVGLRRYHSLRTELQVGINLHPLPGMTLSPAIGGDMVFNVAIEREPGASSSDRVPEDFDRLRAMLILGVRYDFEPEVLREDMRSILEVGTVLRRSDADERSFHGEVRWRQVTRFGFHDLIVQARGLYMGGDVRFWDEVSLAGRHLRVFFGGAYWVSEALQTQAEFRFSVKDDRFKLSIFNDLSIFGDRSEGDRARFGIAEGFGPGVHFLFLDVLAIDFYYGFGFDRHGFAHNASFSLGTVY